MLTYTYRCGDCKHEFEAQQRITDDPIEHCPSCDDGKVQRIITNGNFVRKGVNWERDGYSGGMDNA